MRRIQPRILSSVSFASLAIAGFPALANAQATASPADCSTYSTAAEREACLARQSEETGNIPSASPTTDDDAIVITGSRIRSDFTSSDPLTIINPDVAFQEGYNQTADMINSAPIAAGSFQITGAISNNFVTNGGADAQTVSLRGLGAERTLVLLNGRRAGPAGVRGAVAAFDLNVLPMSIVQSVEILKTGASSIYGSDAIAGVVNILTRRNTDGIEFRGSVSLPQHGGGEVYTGSLTYGRDLGNAHFLLSGDYYRSNNLQRNDRDYLDCNEDYLTFLEGDRADIVDVRTGQPACNGTIGNLFLISNQFLDNPNAPGQQFNGQLLSPPSRFGRQLFIGQFSQPGSDISSVCIPIDPYVNVSTPANFFGCNFDGPSTGAVNQYLPLEQESDVFSQVERYSLYAQGGFEITPSIEIFTELLYNKRKTYNNGYQQFGFFQFTGGSGNPALLPLPAVGLCDPSVDFNCRETDAGDPFNSEFQGNFLLQPLSITESDSGTDIDYYRGVIGARGDFGSDSGWFWDIHGQYSRSEGDYFQDVIFQDAIDTLDFRTRSCAGLKTTVRGVPCIDIDFTNAAGGGPLAGEFTPEQEAFLFGFETGHTVYEQLSGEATLSGTLFTLPAGDVGVAAGVQIRRDEIEDTPGEHTLAENVYGRTSSGITAGHTLSKEVFGELQIPLIHNTALIQSFTVTAAARITDVDATRGDGAEDSFGDTTWKLGFNWEVTDWLRFRGTWGTSFRAPALFELFIENQTGFLGRQAIDVCLNSAAKLAQNTINQRIFDNCATTGIPPTLVGSTGSALISSSGGLGSLEPETSTAKSLGMVLTPDASSWLWGGLSASFSLDYFNITVEDQITQLGGANIVRGCYNSEFFPDEPLCDLITRFTSGNLIFNIDQIENPYINVANQKNSGIDFTAQFRQDMGSWGTLSLLAQMTWQISDTQELFPGNETTLNGEAGEPVWVGDFNLTWAKGDWSVLYGLDVIGGTSDLDDYRNSNAGAVCTTSLFRPGVPLADAVAGGRRRICPDVRLAATDYHTLSVSRRFGDQLQLTVGVRNLFDAQPPRASTAIGGISSIGQSPVFASQYDYLGRRFFLNLRAVY